MSLYSSTRWLTNYFDENYGDMLDANILYFISDGAIICLVGVFLYASSKKDYAAKGSLFLMVSLGIAQAVSFLNNYYYNVYIDYLPVLIIGITALETYKYRCKIGSGIVWLLNKLDMIKKDA